MYIHFYFNFLAVKDTSISTLNLAIILSLHPSLFFPFSYKLTSPPLILHFPSHTLSVLSFPRQAYHTLYQKETILKPPLKEILTPRLEFGGNHICSLV